MPTTRTPSCKTVKTILKHHRAGRSAKWIQNHLGVCVGFVRAVIAESERAIASPRNIYEAVEEGIRLGREETFRPHSKPKPIMAVPGSQEKLDALMARVRAGEELWHEEDGMGCSLS